MTEGFINSYYKDNESLEKPRSHSHFTIEFNKGGNKHCECILGHVKLINSCSSPAESLKKGWIKVIIICQ